MAKSEMEQKPILYAVVCGLGLLIGGGLWWFVRSQSEPYTPPVATCVSASGNLWSNVTLYQDSSCGTVLATVVGGKDGRVLLRYPSGSEEWKERGVATSQYVRQDDPAIAAKQWVEPSN